MSELHLAIEAGKLPKVRDLIRARVDVNARRRSDSKFPLYLASIKGDKSIVDALIGAGANVHATMHDGETPLYIASAWGHAPVVDALLAAGADVNAATRDGTTPLHLASQHGYTDIVKKYLSTCLGRKISRAYWENDS